MLCIRIIILALLGCYVRGAVVQGYNHHPTFLERFFKVMEKRCLRNANEAQFEKIDRGYNKLEECLHNLQYQNRNATVEEVKTHIFSKLPEGVECVKKFADILEPCLDTKESYIKQFLVEGYEKHARYGGEHFDLMKLPGNPFESPVMVCSLQLISQYETDPDRVCYTKSKIFGDNPTLDVATKEDFCPDLKDIIDCYDNLYTEICFPAPEAKLYTVGGLREILTLCSDVLPAGTTENSEEAT